MTGARAEMAAATLIIEEEPRSCLPLTTVVEVFTRDQSPFQAIGSVLAMFWFWSDCKAEEKHLFLGSLFLGLGRFLKSKMAHLLVELLSCFSCHRGVNGDKRPVTMSFSVLGGSGGGGFPLCNGADTQPLQPSVRFFWISRS